MANQSAAVELPKEETKLTRLHARGANSQQRVIWAGLFVPGVNGRRGLPYVLVGKPGSAKTSVIGQLTRQAGLAFEPVLSSLRSPVDFLGVPVPRRRTLDGDMAHMADHDVVGNTQHSLKECPHCMEKLEAASTPAMTYMHYAPAGFSVRAAVAKRAVVLLDEVNTCSPSVQAALLRVLFEGVVGELELPPGVRFLLAMNATEQAAGGFDIAPPLANRMGWIQWTQPTPEEFSRYLTTGGNIGDHERVNAADEEAAVDQLWGKAWAQASGEVGGFLSRRRDLLLKQPDDGGTGKPWPSPRSWEMAARAMAGSRVYDLTPQEEATASGAFIGDATFSEFFTWRKDADLPDPELLLDGGVTFKHDKKRLDRTAAVLSTCASLVTPEKADKRKERASALWKLVQDVSEHAVDVCLAPVAALCNARLMLGDPAAYKTLAKMEPVMSAAGVSR